MYAANELLFPPGSIPMLRQVRGDLFAALIERVISLPEDHPETLAFSLMMIRLDGCMACETDSYRAMRGCTPCARQSLRRFKGSDADLLARYEEALEDVRAYLESRPELIEIQLPIAARAA
ncbi:MAG TPA: hypothetical protein VJJ46_03280 [Anaerolineales bacterium]|nr:hypothetical protein [Anaerolineales bacterium]